MIPFQSLFHADWSTDARKRWVARAARTESGWLVASPRPVGAIGAFVDRLFTARGPVLAGFDFPIGLPLAYGRLTGIPDFRTALEMFGTGEWSEFFTVAAVPAQVSRTRPFYPRAPGGAKRDHLLRGLGIDSVEALFRRCDRKSATRKSACAMFWTLGPNQVGKAAISGWQEAIVPARRRGARLWPFEGSLAELAATGGTVLAEAYPAEAYGHVGVSFRANRSKRRRDDRRLAAAALPGWAMRSGVTFAPDLIPQIADGFGERAGGEDPFDALVGLLGMIEVVDGRRAEQPAGPKDAWEGWILGQAA